MKKIVIFTFICLSNVLSSEVRADCLPVYKDFLKTLEGRMNPARGVLIANSAGAVLAQSIILASVGTITLAGAIGVPAIAVGAGGYYVLLLSQRAHIRNGSHVIRDSLRNDGGDLKYVIKRVNRKLKRNNKPEATATQITDIIKSGNESKDFCKQNDRTDRFKLFGRNKISNYVFAKLAK